MDQLLDYLHKKAPDRILVGNEEINLLIFGVGDQTPTAIKGLLLVVACDFSMNDEALGRLRERYTASLTYRQLYSHGQNMASLAGIPFVMASYQKADLARVDDAYIDSMCFGVMGVRPCQTEFKVLNSAGMVTYLCDAFGLPHSDAGTHKQKNKALADVFHAWSRAKLSSHVVKQDLDAVFIRAENAYSMIEIKRSPTRTVEVWEPFLADARNYDIQNQFSKILNAPFFTFHHNGGACTDATTVGSFKIFDVDLSKKAGWINYRKEIVSADQILTRLALSGACERGDPNAQ